MNFLVRRDVFLAVGGFNERLETAEDVDLCYRLGQLGTVINNPDMEAIHWGEAKNLLIFWRKEVWRGMGNLKGVIAHGLRWDEIPSIGYPLYILCILLFVVISCIHDVWDSRLSLTPVSLILLTLPAFILAVDTTYRTRRIWTLPQLFLLYLIYGLARAYSIVRTIGQQKRLRG